MDYKILYIEDLDAGSIKSDIEPFGIETIAYKPDNFNDTFNEMRQDKYDAILLDFKLSENTQTNILFNAPSLAQTLRTEAIDTKKFKPIFLITNQRNISSYYKDFTSHDLFDLVNEKIKFRKDLENQCNRIKSFIEAYKIIVSSNYDIIEILKANSKQKEFIDHRIIESLSNERYKDNVNKIAFFVYQNIIKSFCFLVGEDILSARLGITKESPGWNDLLTQLSEFKYTGIYSESHNRWWWNEVENWWIQNNKENSKSLRRLNATNRCESIKKMTDLGNLIPVQKMKFSKSENFWTICKQTHHPLDPIDGLELIQKNLYSWQETEYISMTAGLESTELKKYLNSSSLERIREFNNTL